MGELREVLTQLDTIGATINEISHDDGDPDHVTVSSICEATGESESRVREVLASLRQESETDQLVRRLREVEEPMFRVERTTPHTPSTSQLEHHFRRAVPVNKILEQAEKKSHRGRLVLKESLSERVITGAGLLLVLFVVLFFLVQLFLARG